VVSLAKHGAANHPILTTLLRVTCSQTKVWRKHKTFVEIQMNVSEDLGVTPLTQNRNGITAISPDVTFIQNAVSQKRGKNTEAAFK